MSSTRTILVLGRVRSFRVRVFVEKVGGIEYVRVRWRENGQRKTESRPNTAATRKEMKAFAEGLYEARTSIPARGPDGALTLGELWQAYSTAESDHWAPTTEGNYAHHWRKFEHFAGRNTACDLITRETFDLFKRALLTTGGRHGKGHTPNQTRHYLADVKRVFAFGVDRDLIAPNKVISYRYKAPRGTTAAIIPEYTPEEAAKLLTAWDPRHGKQWRPWVLTTLMAYCGPRIDAARRLAWDDVELTLTTEVVDGVEQLVFGGTIVWPSKTDKMKKPARPQPLPGPVAEALWVALGWRQVCRYHGPRVFFSGLGKYRVRDVAYGQSAYNSALHAAEKRVGVDWLDQRGSHSFRRGAGGNALDLTGDPIQAMAWIGDTHNPQLMAKYLQRRAAKERGLAEQMAGALPKVEDGK
jgi:integrase